jgi:hypothetical protein
MMDLELKKQSAFGWLGAAETPVPAVGGSEFIEYLLACSTAAAATAALVVVGNAALLGKAEVAAMDMNSS